MTPLKAKFWENRDWFRPKKRKRNVIEVMNLFIELLFWAIIKIVRKANHKIPA